MRLSPFGLSMLLATTSAPLPGQSDRTVTNTTTNTITIERVATGRWRATYHTAAPVASLRFERPAAFFRERVWTVQTPGYQLTRDGDRQLVVLQDGARAERVVTFEFPEFVEPLPKEYEFFQPFSDGAVAIYTGHLNSAIRTTQSDSTIAMRTTIVVPPSGHHAIVRGRVRDGVVTDVDSTGAGTYVYLGTTTPVETDDVVAVVDPGMPAWLTRQFVRELPRLFEAYRRRFGFRLPWKPTVLYSVHNTPDGGRSSGGGTLEGFISMTIAGAGWREDTPDAREQAFDLIAHESAHLWNGQLVANADGTRGAWMHEGAAEAMATDMLRALGVIDSARARRREERAITQCAAAVAAGSVVTAISRGAVRDAYDCGHLMALWSAAAVARVSPAGDLFGIWHAVITSAQAARQSYDQDRYFAVLRDLGVSDAVTTAMRTFVHTDGAAAMTIAIDGLRAAGVAIEPDTDTPPAAYQQGLARAALVHVMTQACQRVDLRWGIPAKTGAVNGCAPFAVPHDVFAVSGHDLRDDGVGVYDAVRRACAANAIVTLEARDARPLASVPCSRVLRERPVRYRYAR